MNSNLNPSFFQLASMALNPRQEYCNIPFSLFNSDDALFLKSVTVRHGIRDNESIEIRRTFAHPKFDFPSLYNDIAVSELGNHDSTVHGTASQAPIFII